VLADLLEYPSANWHQAAASRAHGDGFARFQQRVENLSLSDLQEIYTRTFDLNPVCALEIGYHLFGENYKRGEFLANLRQTEAPFDLGQEKQLPDYLPVLLRLLTKLEDEELRIALIVECMIPAIEKMITSLKDSENPYRFLLETVKAVLRNDAGANERSVAAIRQRPSLPIFQPVEQPARSAQ
jgi:nitrate reductase delta subunit